MTPSFWPSRWRQPIRSRSAVTGALTAANQTAAISAITGYDGGVPAAAALTAIAGGLNNILSGPSLYSPAAFLNVPLPPDVSAMLGPPGTGVPGALNLALLRAAFPVALEPGRAGHLGRQRSAWVASAFWVRYSCIAFRPATRSSPGSRPSRTASTGASASRRRRTGARFRRPTSRTSIASDAALFASTSFGEPAYAQLRETADAAIDTASVTGGSPQSISAGAENGSEMGAYSSQLGPLNEQRLLTKYAEYMPLGLTPVVIHVT